MAPQTPAPPPFTTYRLIGAEVIEVPADQVPGAADLQQKLLRSRSLLQMTGGQPLVDIEAFQAETGLLCLQGGGRDHKTYAWRVGLVTQEGPQGLEGVDQKITLAAMAMLNPLKPLEEQFEAPDLSTPAPAPQERAPASPQSDEGQRPGETPPPQQPPVGGAPQQQTPPLSQQQPPAPAQQQQQPPAPAQQQQQPAPGQPPGRQQQPMQAPLAPPQPPPPAPAHPLPPVDGEEERLLRLNENHRAALTARLERDLNFDDFFQAHDGAQLALGAGRAIAPRHLHLIGEQREGFRTLLDQFSTQTLETFIARQKSLENLNRLHLQNHKNPNIENPEELIHREQNELIAHQRETRTILGDLLVQQSDELRRLFLRHGSELETQSVPAPSRVLIAQQQRELMREFTSRRTEVNTDTVRHFQTDRTTIQEEHHRGVYKKIVNDVNGDIATLTAQSLAALAIVRAEHEAALLHQASLPMVARVGAQLIVDAANAALVAATAAQALIAVQAGAANAARLAIAAVGADHFAQATAALEARVAAREQGVLLATIADLAKLATDSRTAVHTARTTLEQTERHRELVENPTDQPLVDAQIAAARRVLQAAETTHRAILASVQASNPAAPNLANITHRRDQAKIQKIKQELSQIAFHLEYMIQRAQIEANALRLTPNSDQKTAQLEGLRQIYQIATEIAARIPGHLTTINTSIHTAMAQAAAAAQVAIAEATLTTAAMPKEAVDQLVRIAKAKQQQTAQLLPAPAAPQPQRGRSWLGKGAMTVGALALAGGAYYLGSDIDYSTISPMVLRWLGNTPKILQQLLQ